MKKRRPVVFVDDGDESRRAVRMLKDENIDHITYHTSKFNDSCCGDAPTTVAPSVFAHDGVFKGLRGVEDYISYVKSDSYAEESSSAYW